MYSFEIELGYTSGNVQVKFSGNEYPENWTEVREKARMRVLDQLYEIADIHDWRDNFETAQTYSAPGVIPNPEVGTVTISDENEITVELTIDSVHDCDWE